MTGRENNLKLGCAFPLLVNRREKEEKKMTSVPELKERKVARGSKPITLLTAYDFASAVWAEAAQVDAVLVGDSLGMVIQGQSDTLSVTPEMITYHTKLVKSGIQTCVLIADFPFLIADQGWEQSINAAKSFIQAGAQAVKIEGAQAHRVDIIKRLIASGVPVMGHVGLTPQSVHQMGGYKVQGKDEQAAAQIKEDVIRLQDAGCFSIVLECIPAPLADELTSMLDIPTIGIGAGADCDGQVLVMHDVLNLLPGRKPKFVRPFLDGFELITSALKDYVHAVESGDFPRPEESYSATNKQSKQNKNVLYGGKG